MYRTSLVRPAVAHARVVGRAWEEALDDAVLREVAHLAFLDVYSGGKVTGK